MTDKNLIPVTGDTWATIKAIAPVAQASRMFGVTIEQAAIVMLKGHELGLGLAGAFEFIHVIDGKPSISPKGALALIQRSGELVGLEIHDLTDGKGTPTRCKVTMKRKNGFSYTVEYSMTDAQRAGVVKDKSAWEKYPANMLRWRAVGYCADVVFPDVLGGLMRPEELGAEVDAEGQPIEAPAWHMVEEKPQPASQPQSAKIETPAANPQPVVSEVSETAKIKTLFESEKPAEPVKEPEAKEPELVKEQETPTTTIPDNLTVADLLSRGYGVADLQTAIQALQAEGMTVHFPPATSEECKLVLERLEAK